MLILDEPTTGLDPNQLVEIRALIKALGKEKTVLFSTHIMQEVEAVCDRVIIIKKGEILIDKKLKELQNNNQQVIKVVFNTKIDEDKLYQIPYLLSVDKLDHKSWKLFFKTQEDMRSQIFDFAQDNELKILELVAENKNLESLFRELTLQ